MGFSIRRVHTLVIKETKDLIKNMNVFLVCLIPLAATIFLSMMNASQTFDRQSLPLFFIMNSCMIAPISMAMLIAEEKEKNTMRTLMLSTVSPMEFLAGKAIVTWLLIGVTNIGIFFALETPTNYLLFYAINGILLSTIMIVLGAIIGIASKNLMSSGTNSMPLILVFYLIPALAKGKEEIESIAYLLPTYHAELFINRLLDNENVLVTGRQHLIVLVIWVVIVAVAFSVIFKRNRFDD